MEKKRAVSAELTTMGSRCYKAVVWYIPAAANSDSLANENTGYTAV